MPNDDLGQFPSPTSADPTPVTDQPTGIPATAPVPEQSPAFEQTPDEIPSVPATPASFSETPTELEIQPAPPEEPIPASPPPQEPVPVSPPPQEPIPASLPPQEIPAVIVPKGGSSFGSLITIIILLIAGVAIAAAVFLFSQSKQLKQQIQEITQTLEKQKTTITPTPTPTIFEFTTPTPTPESTISATPTVFPTPVSTISAETALPLFNASKALRVAINHQPNAQLILIKTENATTPRTASTKYFFRQDLTTKKYFYVMITGIADPEVVDKSIYVTPDNNIPSLNDLVLGNTLGIDLNEAVKIAYDLCTGGLCKDATVKAQYIKSEDNVIWQLSFAPADTTKETLVLQLNAQTKAILFKSPGF